MRRVSFCDDRNCHPRPWRAAEASRGSQVTFRKSVAFSDLLSSTAIVLAPSPWRRTCSSIRQESVHGANEQDNSAGGYG